MKKYILSFLGMISIALGVTGIFIPVLPTTPFLLLASFCFLRSSERMYSWLINHKYLGTYINCYLTYKAIPRKTKIITMIFLWPALIVSMLIVPVLYIRIFLFAVGIGVTIHLMILKTISFDDMRAISAEDVRLKYRI